MNNGMDTERRPLGTTSMPTLNQKTVWFRALYSVPVQRDERSGMTRPF
ncbi:hypothetical protein HC752_15660 [Vibrio sp. S9_S30]|nr:hypothetical protein [Vibrio sp. S9_S30]MBD1558373.1 hypothetical protein [Vibrio sp. S9_S30]